MITKVYYVIWPNSSLIDFLSDKDDFTWSNFGRPTLWSRTEGGKSAWKSTDYSDRAKIIYIAFLWKDYVINGEQLGTKSIVTELLGGPPFSETVFDKWWTIERWSGEDYGFEDVFNHVKANALPLMKPVNPLVEAWLLDKKQG
jgi:hypothetical protein